MVTSASPRPAGRRGRRAWAAVPLAVALVAACSSSDDDGDDATTTEEDAASSGSGETITLGYSAWPGWFPWAVAEEAGIFEEVGVDVELEYFSDYLSSLDAMNAGQLDANSQTLNDTLVGVSAGSDQVVVVVNDNSDGNDAIIVDESIETIEDLEGASIAAEPGVVDHFLLLQGLDSVGLTEDDVEFEELLTDQAAATFASGQLDGVGVFAPFTVQALEREGSHVLFDSSDFPGTIPDFLTVNRSLVEERPEDVQLLVDAWYATLAYIEENPEEATEIMAERAEVTVEDYESFADGTRIFTAEEALESLTGDAETDLGPMTEQVSAFLVDTGLVEEEADVEGLYDPSFTEDYLEREGA
jgi:NitT/TauT family transport system substrate-binding protein